MAASEKQMADMDTVEYARRLKNAYNILAECGCHYVIDSVKDLPPVIDDINRKMASGERP